MSVTSRSPPAVATPAVPLATPPFSITVPVAVPLITAAAFTPSMVMSIEVDIPPTAPLSSPPRPRFIAPPPQCSSGPYGGLMSQCCVGVVPKSLFLGANGRDRMNGPVRPEKAAISDKSRQAWSFAGWRFTPGRGTLLAPDGRSVDLTRQETRLLTLFLQAGGRTLTRGFLLDSLGEPDRPVYDRAVDKLVNRLRQKL